MSSRDLPTPPPECLDYMPTAAMPVCYVGAEGPS